MTWRLLKIESSRTYFLVSSPPMFSTLPLLLLQSASCKLNNGLSARTGHVAQERSRKRYRSFEPELNNVRAIEEMFYFEFCCTLPPANSLTELTIPLFFIYMHDVFTEYSMCKEGTITRATSSTRFKSLKKCTVLMRTFQIKPKLCTLLLHELDPRTKSRVTYRTSEHLKSTSRPSLT